MNAEKRNEGRLWNNTKEGSLSLHIGRYSTWQREKQPTFLAITHSENNSYALIYEQKFSSISTARRSLQLCEHARLGEWWMMMDVRGMEAQNNPEESEKERTEDNLYLLSCKARKKLNLND